MTPHWAQKTVFLLFLTLPAWAGLWVEQVDDDRAVIRVDGEAGLDRPTDGLSSNQLVYVTAGGEVKSRLRLVYISPPRVEARILSGRVQAGEAISLSLEVTWEHLFNPWDLTRIDAYLRARENDLSLGPLVLLWQTVAPYLPLAKPFALTPTRSSGELMANLSQTLARKDPANRRAWQRFALLLYRHHILGQNIQGSLDLFLERESTEETLDGALRLRAELRRARGDLAGALSDFGKIIRRKAQVAAVVQASLATSQILATFGEREKALRLLDGLTRMESDDPGLAGGIWDEAALLQSGLLAQSGDRASIEAAMALLSRVRRHGGDLGILSRAWFAEFRLAQAQNNPSVTERVRRDFEEAIPDSPLRAEMDYLEAVAVVDAGTQAGLQRLDPLQAVVIKWPGEKAGLRAYQTLLQKTLAMGEWPEMLRLIQRLQNRWPLERIFTSPLPVLAPALTAAIAKENQDPTTQPFQADAYFYRVMADTRSAYRPLNQAPLVPSGRFHQALSAAFTLTRPILLEHARFDPQLVALAANLECQWNRRFGIDTVALAHDLRRLARLSTFPPLAASAVAHDLFQTLIDQDPLAAEKQALEILRLGADSGHVDEVFTWFSKRMGAESDPLLHALTYRHLVESYDRLDLRVEDLRREMGTWVGAPQVQARLALGEVPGRPAHALVFSHTNGFDRFDITRDLADLGSNRNFRLFKVTGPHAALESRFLTLRARDYGVLKLSLLVEDGDLLDRGTLWWQDWTDSTWSTNKMVPFFFLGPGETTATIPLSHPAWLGTIKRLKIDFQTPAYPSRETRLLLREIVLY